MPSTGTNFWVLVTEQELARQGFHRIDNFHQFFMLMAEISCMLDLYCKEKMI